MRLEVGDRIGDAAARAQTGNRRRQVELGGITIRVALPFVATKKEEFVSDNWSAECASELLQFARSLRSSHHIEPVASIHRRVSAECVGASMKSVRARFQANVYDCAWFPAVL